MQVTLSMENNRLPIIAVIAVAALIGIMGAYTFLIPQGDVPAVSSAEAIGVVKNDSMAIEYFESYFKVDDWRVTSTVLVDSVPNGTVREGGVWRVRIMERSCACSGIKDLFVIEGYVSANTGELLNIETKSVLESEYDKKTCSSTSCH